MTFTSVVVDDTDTTVYTAGANEVVYFTLVDGDIAFWTWVRSAAVINKDFFLVGSALVASLQTGDEIHVCAPPRKTVEVGVVNP